MDYPTKVWRTCSADIQCLTHFCKFLQNGWERRPRSSSVIDEWRVCFSVKSAEWPMWGRSRASHHGLNHACLSMLYWEACLPTDHLIWPTIQAERDARIAWIYLRCSDLRDIGPCRWFILLHSLKSDLEELNKKYSLYTIHKDHSILGPMLQFESKSHSNLSTENKIPVVAEPPESAFMQEEIKLQPLANLSSSCGNIILKLIPCTLGGRQGIWLFGKVDQLQTGNHPHFLYSRSMVRLISFQIHSGLPY